jgi:xanthine dehydrogenase small subunit
MEVQLECIINNTSISTSVNPGIVLLDFLRKEEHLTGTKEGCREGDCGACTVLLGELRGTDVVYTSVNSCLLPVGDVQGKHVVTIEGINQPEELTPIQQAMIDEGGTQCGFCTPGFVISLTGYCLTDARAPRTSRSAHDDAITAVDGNICRCTGHSPIKRSIKRVNEFLSTQVNDGGSPLEQLVGQKILPAYFLTIAQRLGGILPHEAAGVTGKDIAVSIVSGGTDLYVQKAFTMHSEPTLRLSTLPGNGGIVDTGTHLNIPGTTTVEDFRRSPIVARYFPSLAGDLLLFGSTPIRGRATIAGNLANASPIGDMTCLLMAMDATLTLRDGDDVRTLPLRKLYTGYKQLDKKRTELITSIALPTPTADSHLSYEKVSRRQHLDIASVNSTMMFELRGGRMANVGISAGGVGPVMMHLTHTSEYFNGKVMDGACFAEAAAIASREISPISDARGSAAYKRLLLRQLLAAHVMKYFPGVVTKEALA